MCQDNLTLLQMYEITVLKVMMKELWSELWNPVESIGKSKAYKGLYFSWFSTSIQFSSVAQSCQTLCDPMGCSTPGFPALELAQTHVHWVSDASQLSHPLLSPSPPAFNLSHHQGRFKWVSSSHQVAKVLELQHQSFQWIFMTDFLQDWLVDLLPAWGTLKNLLQHHSSKASILWYSAFFIVQLSYPYMTTGKP